jgi:hypothetical protein
MRQEEHEVMNQIKVAVRLSLCNLLELTVSSNNSNFNIVGGNLPLISASPRSRTN